ncbi:tRNA (adenosine(37)-N6)-dimethylallyltransferase MiaA [Nonlabens spongiae]|uniref:tRNA dimethylallyltransferase n=1 Tax=Nonlabens spongiae TaxID=331648 RepID=A0A1W6MK23_9FLAO|nr:tRNA (adenosine(37)-N6)-dimethylallyltransferase MiaA [Nonlabens spongiae]ARN77819.1 tRNA (adenosine(37)-N6)-dimethylallyltransferase MiaA [Nonlabens spongiae]
MSKKTLIAVIGPTAVGKTALGIAFAKAYKTSIISCDSRQFYKEMTVGTAVPNPDELAEAEHYFIQDRSIDNPLTAGSFEKEVMELLDNLFVKNDVVVMVGGSALYEKAVTEGLNHFPDIPEEIRGEISQKFESKGLEWLQNEVKQKDPEFYENADQENPRRLIRALEIFKTSSRKLSDFQTGNADKRPFKVIKVGLEADREELYDRINKRVDLMFTQGLFKEAEVLKNSSSSIPKSTVGYQEIFPVFDGQYDIDEAIRLIKRNSRRFAKRQMTWYRKDDSVHWFNYKTRHNEIVQRVSQLMGK